MFVTPCGQRREKTVLDDAERDRVRAEAHRRAANKLGIEVCAARERECVCVCVCVVSFCPQYIHPPYFFCNSLRL